MSCCAGQCLQARIWLDAAILGHAQEDDTVDGALHGVVQFVNRQGRIAQRQIARQGSRQPSISLRNSASTGVVPRLPLAVCAYWSNDPR